MLSLNKQDADRAVKLELRSLGGFIRFLTRNIFDTRHPLRRVDSFKYAFKGVFHALLNEPNFRIQCAIVLATLVFGFLTKLTHIEWAILALSEGILLSAELVNTVVEELLDHLIPERSSVVAIIKDLSAGYVLIMALTNLALLIIIFGYHLLA